MKKEWKRKKQTELFSSQVRKKEKITIIILIILIIFASIGFLSSFINTNFLSGRAGSNETNISEPCIDICPSEVCVDDCDYSGQKICSGKYAKTCGYYDSDKCLDLNKGTYCFHGCSAGSCLAKANQTNQTQSASNQTNSTNQTNISDQTKSESNQTNQTQSASNQTNNTETKIESNQTDSLIEETIPENETNETDYEIIISNDTNYTLEDSNNSNFTISVDNNTINISISPNTTEGMPAKISIEQALSKAVYIEKVEKVVLSLEPGGLVYLVSGKREGKLIGMINVSAKIKQKIDANSGILISTKKPWWSFLATNI